MKLNTLHQPGPSFIEYKTYVIGVNEAADSGSDFTAAATTQTFTLDSLNPGDIVILPQCRVDVLENITHAAATWSIVVGITGTTARFIPSTDLKAAASTIAQGGVVVGTLEANLVPYANQTAAAIAAVCVVTVATGTVATTSAGRFAITLAIMRKADRVKGLQSPA